jgi:transcriptional regulator with XRE-family HTH domain
MEGQRPSKKRGKTGAKGMYTEFAQKLKFLRKVKNWNIAKLAQKTGLRSSYIRKLEEGKEEPTQRDIRMLASIFDCQKDFFLDTAYKRIDAESKEDRSLEQAPVGSLQAFEERDSSAKAAPKAEKAVDEDSPLLPPDALSPGYVTGTGDAIVLPPDTVSPTGHLTEKELMRRFKKARRKAGAVAEAGEEPEPVEALVVEPIEEERTREIPPERKARPGPVEEAPPPLSAGDFLLALIEVLIDKGFFTREEFAEALRRVQHFR